MIVVAIIAILSAVAVPKYLQYGRNSQFRVCIANLRTLEGAMEQRKLIGDAGEPTMELLCEPIGYIKGEPRCPADKSGHYDISGEVPLCPNRDSFPDHRL